jgi:hypothetical protein
MEPGPNLTVEFGACRIGCARDRGIIMSNAIHTGHYEVSAYQNADGWHYRLNDGLFDVGPYPSEQEAVEAAMCDLRELRFGGEVYHPRRPWERSVRRTFWQWWPF